MLHDFRRSAVRNMIHRGVPQKTAMKPSGYKTDAIFSRYNIVSEADLRDAVRRSSRAPKRRFTVPSQLHKNAAILRKLQKAQARKPS